ncbi:hypothetical protein R3P38DRAFT_3237435 [Favolaschia claudopus]|uniref:DUF6533 domain-containing protein n=1 Tax=Favolaschia claudopus TaxID=2862362 RepID=A0AAV9ZAW0_9AGAR
MSSPNPETPLALLPSDVAAQLRIAEYVTVGTLAAFIWDVLCNAPNDWKLVTKHRIGMGTWVYFIARFCTMFYIITSTLLLTYPVGDCVLAHQIYTSASAMVMPANGLLMFLRTRAIFNNNKHLVFLLLFLWLLVVGTAIPVTLLVAIPAALVSFDSYICQTMGFVSTVMVTNCMTSYVFRNTKLGYIDRIMTTTEMTGIEFAGRSRGSDSHGAAVGVVE